MTFGPDGTAWQVALVLTGSSFAAGSGNGIAVSRSTDGGRTWSDPQTRDGDGAEFFNDKEAIAADPTDARYVYVTWDRLARDRRRAVLVRAHYRRRRDWEPARPILDLGTNAQTLNNIPIGCHDGTLINFFTRIDYHRAATRRRCS